jgi:hypothetical protein
LKSENTITLLNESCCKGRHFFDLIITMCRSFGIACSFGQYRLFPADFASIRPLILLIEWRALRAASVRFETAVAQLADPTSHPAIIELIERCNSDMAVVRTLRKISGEVISKDLLLRVAIPQSLKVI